jgi:hypothetical protein
MTSHAGADITIEPLTLSRAWAAASPRRIQLLTARSASKCYRRTTPQGRPPILALSANVLVGGQK